MNTDTHRFRLTQEATTLAGRDPASFRSILFGDAQPGAEADRTEAPEYFRDLNLDQIVDAITAGREEYDLKPFFYAPLRDAAEIRYRQEVLRDLEERAVLEPIRWFGEEMRRMRALLTQAEKLYYERQKQSYFLDAADIYCVAAIRLASGLAAAVLRSRGLRGFHEYLQHYTTSAPFRELADETAKLRAGLAGVTYSLEIEGKRIKVGRYGDEPDYGAEVLQTFEKFRQGAPKDYRFEIRAPADMNHVEAAILDRVALLFPGVFAELEAFRDRHRGYLDATIAEFDREAQFYLACHEHVQRFARTGLRFCYPAVTADSKEAYGRDVFDLALANRLLREDARVVTNDFHLEDPERIIIVSGPNQGGKTTFARMFGQLHHLASIGCPVPGSEARLFLFDRLFTHFEREESIETLSSKLEEDLTRIRRILEAATPNSILIMNESFLSTTLDDALFLTREIMRQVVELDMLCVSVTFLDELASFSPTTVSMVSTVDPADPAMRTFRIVRRLADGLAYAIAIAEKYNLTYDGIKRRLDPEAGEGRGE